MQYIEDKDVHTLIVHGASPEESGLYTCRASNKHGSVDTTAEVRILPPSSKIGGSIPAFVNKPDSMMTITVGDDIMLAFHVSGDPKPHGKSSIFNKNYILFLCKTIHVFKSNNSQK